MKKFITMLLLVAIAASCTIAFAAGEFVEFKNSAYIFNKAGSDRTKVIIKRGSVVEKKGEKGNWTNIKFDDSEGWVRTKYTKKSSETKELVVYSSGGAKKSKETTKTGTTTKTSATTTGKVNFRNGASLSSKVIKSLKKGTKVTLSGTTQEDSRGVTFYKVKVDGKEGWVSEKYLKID